MATEKKNKFRDNPAASQLIADVQEPVLEQNDVEDYEVKKPKKNRVKSAPKTEKAETPVTPRKKEIKPGFSERLAERLQNFKTFYNDERTQKIIGLVLILVSGYLA